MKELHDLRLQIDKAINSTKLITPSRELSLAHTQLQRAKMWLGKCLGEVGESNPYLQSMNAESAQIEPQADHGADDFSQRLQPPAVAPGDPVIRPIKEFRLIIQEITDLAEAFQNDHAAEELTMKFRLFYQQSVLALIEAKLWLGMVLDAIRSKAA